MTTELMDIWLECDDENLYDDEREWKVFDEHDEADDQSKKKKFYLSTITFIPFLQLPTTYTVVNRIR